MEKHNTNSNKTSLSDSKSQEVQYDIAYKKVKKIKGFYVHLLVYILVNIFVLFKKYYSKEATIFWDWQTFNTTLFWGIGLVSHAVSVFGCGLVFKNNWEERKIKELMDKEKNEANKWR